MLPIVALAVGLFSGGTVDARLAADLRPCDTIGGDRLDLVVAGGRYDGARLAGRAFRRDNSTIAILVDFIFLRDDIFPVDAVAMDHVSNSRGGINLDDAGRAITVTKKKIFLPLLGQTRPAEQLDAFTIRASGSGLELKKGSVFTLQLRPGGK